MVDVLHVIPFGSPAGGTERSVADLMASPVLAGLVQQVVFLRDSPDGPFAPEDVHRPPARDPFRRITAARRALRPRVVQGWLYPANLAAAATKPLSRSALVTAERNLGTELSRARRLGERLVAAAEDVSVANSTAVRDAAIGRIPGRAAAMRVILPGIADRGLRHGAPAWDCVMVGRLTRVKDHATALAAFARLAAAGMLGAVAIVGDGPERQALADAIARLELDDVVRLVGEADPEPYLEAARVYVSSSLAEGWSRAMLEAIRAGLPVATTAVGGALDLDAVTARRVAVGDAAALADAIGGLLADDEGRRLAGEAARRLFEARFRAETCHAAYRDLYRELGARQSA